MKARSFLTRHPRKLLLALLAGGFVAQAFSGCNPDLRDTLLTGVQTSITGLVATMIDAFFKSLMSTSSTSQPVVQAIIDALPTLA